MRPKDGRHTPRRRNGSPRHQSVDCACLRGPKAEGRVASVDQSKGIRVSGSCTASWPAVNNQPS